MKKRRNIYIGIVALLLLSCFLIYNFSPSFSSLDHENSLNWEMLNALDYRTGTAPSWLRELNGKTVRIPGFVVPLEDNYRQASEFLLVPDPGSCVHAPPPPPNQMIFVKMKDSKSLSLTGRPMWIMGTLHLRIVRSPFGAVAYTLDGESGVAFKYWKEFMKANGRGGGY